METIKIIYKKVRSSTFLKNKYLNFILKTLIVMGLGYAVYRRITSEEKLDEMLLHILDYLSFPNLFFIIAVGFLTPFMWWAESYRWLILVRRIVTPSSATFWKSFRAMISGHAIGIFLHNRIGKIGGRIITYESKKKAELLVVNYFDGEAIKLLLDIYGFLGGLYVLHIYMHWEKPLVIGLGIVFLAILIFRIYIFYNVHKLVWFIGRFQLQERYMTKIRILEKYSIPELRKIMQITGFRIALNYIQYYLVMRFFHINVPFFEAFVLISAIYFVVSNVPLPSLPGVLMRINLAIYIWSHYTDNIISISAIPLVLWVFNTLVPTIIGTYFLMNTNLAKNISNVDLKS